jgi:hypothetical protein
LGQPDRRHLRRLQENDACSLFPPSTMNEDDTPPSSHQTSRESIGRYRNCMDAHALNQCSTNDQFRLHSRIWKQNCTTPQMCPCTFSFQRKVFTFIIIHLGINCQFSEQNNDVWLCVPPPPNPKLTHTKMIELSADPTQTLPAVQPARHKENTSPHQRHPAAARQCWGCTFRS